MRVLVTGAAGFIGSHVVRSLLRRGDEVLALLRPGTEPTRLADVKDRIRLVAADLDAPDSVTRAVAETRPEGCIHLAWYAVPGKYLHAEAENLACLQATLNLVQQLRETGCRQFVGAGTCIELDTDAGYLTRSTPPKPRTVYAAAKHATQVLAAQLCQGSPLRFAWLRVFYLYGPGENRQRLVPYVIRSLEGGERVELTAGEQVRDYLHVADVAEAFARVLHTDASGPLNLGGGQPVTVKALVQTLGRLLGRTDLLRFGARPTPPDEPPFICADPEPLKATGWRPQFDLESGLRDTLAWWQGATSCKRAAK
jgi:nucleoside-diphosphate-sugar epimerase